MTYQKGYTIEIKNSPVMNVLAVRDRMGVDEFGKYYGTLFERVPKDRVTPTGLNGARYFDEEFNSESSDIEVFVGIREKDKADKVITIDNLHVLYANLDFKQIQKSPKCILSV